MQPDSPARKTKARHIRVPAFLPVPLRARADGWTAPRQAAFLVALARSGSVAGAAREVGLSRASAYALRARPGAGGIFLHRPFLLREGRIFEIVGRASARFRASAPGRFASRVGETLV